MTAVLWCSSIGFGCSWLLCCGLVFAPTYTNTAYVHTLPFSSSVCLCPPLPCWIYFSSACFFLTSLLLGSLGNTWITGLTHTHHGQSLRLPSHCRSTRFARLSLSHSSTPFFVGKRPVFLFSLPLNVLVRLIGLCVFGLRLLCVSSC